MPFGGSHGLQYAVKKYWYGKMYSLYGNCPLRSRAPGWTTCLSVWICCVSFRSEWMGQQ